MLNSTVLSSASGRGRQKLEPASAPIKSQCCNTDKWGHNEDWSILPITSHTSLLTA